jgi:hypothetical protein
MILIGAIVLLTSAGSLMAQEADTTAPAMEAPAAEAPAVEPPAAEAPAAEAPAADAAVEGAAVAEAEPAHDWEFTLSATDKAPGASATVQVMEAEQGSDFVLVASGLPVIDSLDEENRDVNAYTVWVVPGKDKVAESQLVGVLTVSADGTGRLEGETSLETFGVIVAATPDAAPETISGIPVLTGIPVQADAPPEAMEEAEEAAENVAEEAADVAEETDPAEIAEEEAEVSEEVSEGMEEVEEAEEAAQEEPETP